MSNIERQLREEELRAIEREEMESLLEINGHAYASSYKPDKNEMDILLHNTDDVIRECKNGDADLNTDAELVSREILTRSNREMMIYNQIISDSKFKCSKVKQLPPSIIMI